MIHRCPNCPASNTLLQDFLFHTIGDVDDNDVIEFSQWTTTDRSNLTHHTETVNAYVNIVIEQLHILTVHSYISKCSLRYLKKLKSEIDNSTVLLLGDFAENYQFVIQDEVQGSHWNNSKCTLHPVATYYQKNEELKNTSFCVISDDTRFFIRNQNFENRLAQAYGKSLFNLKVCLHYAYSLKFC